MLRRGWRDWLYGTKGEPTMKLSDVYKDRVRIRMHGDSELVDKSNDLGIILFRAPNRYRRLLRVPKGNAELDFIYKNDECITLQTQEYELDMPYKPIGFQATMDNDIAIAWERL